VLDHAQDESELGVVDADDQQAAGVRPSRSRPFGRDPGEVPDVEGDHDPSLVGRERKKLLILPTVELAFLVRGADVMLLAQSDRDAASGDVRVEEQPHGLSVADGDRVDRRILALELSDRSLALGDRGVYLVRKLGVVGERQPDLWLRQTGGGRHLARRAVRA
jgi:hypothetical protein